MLTILFLLSCLSDYSVITKAAEECENVIIEDTAFDFSDIWVDSFTQVSALDGVDIFWVIDPSGSMIDDQPRILAGIQHMMNSLPPTGWRLMIIPTDHHESSNMSVFPIVPGDTILDVERMYNMNINGRLEAGFDGVLEYILYNPYATTWLRNDAALLIVFVSDEDDQSSEHVLSEYDFIGTITNYRRNTYLSSIVNVNPDESECERPPGLLTVGNKYINATNYLNGNIVDICSENWSAGVGQASSQIIPLESIELTHVPLDPSWIYVYINGALNTDWYYDPSDNRVYFTTIPSANSLVEVVYNYESTN